MAKINQQDRDFLKLIERSPDRGDGWRSVSATCWTLVEAFGVPELLEIDKDNMRVRLTEAGNNVARYTL